MRTKSRKFLWISAIAIVGIIVVTVLVLGGGWFRGQNAQAVAEPEPGQVVMAFTGDLAPSASASGQLLPDQEARLALGTSGRVEHVYVQVSDQVRAGDLLVQLESDDLQRAVASAEQSLAMQEANLAELLKEPDARDVAAAEASVANAQAQLDDLLAGPSDEELAQAEAARISTQARLDDLLAGPSEEELAQARAALQSAQATLRAAEARYEALGDQLVIAQNDINNAQLAKDRARDQYNLLVWNDWKAGVSWAPYSPQGAAVERAQIDYDVAVANYNLTQINANDSAYRSAQAQVAQAEAALAALTEDKTAQIASARSQVAHAKATLATLAEEQTAQIAAARAQLAQARANLAKLLDGASDEQRAIAKAQVEQARISLEEAKDNLEDATLRAPFDGMVTDVTVTAGEWASGPAVEMVDIDSLQVVLDVDEIDIGEIEVGQPTVITLETWPDRELQGKVIAVAPKADNVGEIVTYQVRLGFDAGALPVLTGMTASARLITSSRENVLLVPNRAIIADRQEGKYYVNRMEGEGMKRVEVTIGLRDDSHTEILSGLEEGDRLFIGEIEEGLDFRSGPPSGVRELPQ